MATLEQYRKQALKATEKDMKRDIADSNTIYQNQAENVKGKYGTQIDLSTQEYDDLERQNEVQRYINARNVAENNASLGLTDSGLNRTQQTAVQLSASNNAAKIARDRQNMVNALTQEMNSLLTEIENNRIASEASIRKEYEQNAHNTAVSQYNAEQSAAAKYSSDLAKQKAVPVDDKLSDVILAQIRVLKNKGAKARNDAGEDYDIKRATNDLINDYLNQLVRDLKITEGQAIAIYKQHAYKNT